MPLGLKNALHTFNQMMDKIFKSHCFFTTRVFFDNILVFSKILKEHKEHLKKIFRELKNHKVYINGKKSEFLL